MGAIALQGPSKSKRDIARGMSAASGEQSWLEATTNQAWGNEMLGTILLIILILLLIGALPTWPYSGGWGYYPSGGLGLLLIIVIVLLLVGRI